eukprot:jgi/Phyca11/115962/e_gw1.29.502.1
MTGPPPTSAEVTDFAKNWRRKNPKDSMAPLIALCDGRLYDQLDLAMLSPTEMIILCDSQPGTLNLVQSKVVQMYPTLTMVHQPIHYMWV